MSAGELRSTFDPAAGTISIEFTPGPEGFPEGSRLALTSIVQLSPGPATRARLVRRLATYHELEPVTDGGLRAAEAWAISGLSISHVPHHANDGPMSAFVILPGRLRP